MFAILEKGAIFCVAVIWLRILKREARDGISCGFLGTFV
jgi:hypothetical protein